MRYHRRAREYSALRVSSASLERGRNAIQYSSTVQVQITTRPALHMHRLVGTGHGDHGLAQAHHELSRNCDDPLGRFTLFTLGTFTDPCLGILLKPDAMEQLRQMYGRITKLRITGKWPGRSRFGLRNGAALNMPPDVPWDVDQHAAGMCLERSRGKIDLRINEHNAGNPAESRIG